MTQQEIESLQRKISDWRSPIGVDTETNWTDDYAERYCMGVSISFAPGDTHYIAVQHNDWLSPPTNLVIPPDFFSNVTVPIGMHNAFFDIQVTDRLGCKLPKDQTYCTLIMDHYIDENRWPSFELEVVAKDRLGVAKEADLKQAMKKEWDNTPDFVMAKYAEQDADLHRRLLNQMAPEFAPYKELWDTVDRDVLYILLSSVKFGWLRLYGN
jgi:DNA polymerase I-like protein with 3'-5' exonuclease and polymerase domains